MRTEQATIDHIAQLADATGKWLDVVGDIRDNAPGCLGNAACGSPVRRS